MKYKYIRIMGFILGFIFIFSIFTVNSNAKNYVIKDMKSSDPAYEAVQKVLSQGWMSLTLQKFYPNKPISRGEFAVVLAKFNSDMNSIKNITKTSFKDVFVKDSFAKYIEAEKKYISFYKQNGGNYFKPKNDLTREDAVVALVKALGYDSEEAVKNDVDSEVSIEEIIEDSDKISPALKNYVVIGVVNELIDLQETNSGSYLNPKKSITRKQLAMLLVNSNDKKNFNIEDGDNAVIDNSSDASKNGADNSSDNKQSNTANSNVSESNIESAYKNTVSITTNDNKKNFISTENLKFNQNDNVWTIVVYEGELSTTDNLVFRFPKDVKGGATYIVNTEIASSKSYNQKNYANITYLDKDFKAYVPGLESTDGYNLYDSSYCKITVDKWEGKGGIASGTIEAYFKSNANGSVYLTNGKFRFVIE